MASNRPVWGIEVGQCALKAIKLRAVGDGTVEVLGFDVVEHEKILSQPDAEPEALVKAAIEKFVARNDWQKDSFVIGVPGQQTFARFVKMPPVDVKKIGEMVRYEAEQQIPFDMNDVVWDYHVFQTKDSPDVEVGIFAMRRDLIRKHLDNFSAAGITPSAIQTNPSALYNFCSFEGQGEIGPNQATVIVDVGCQNTDLIVVEANSAWTRNIPLGGNNFTDALVKAFKLSFAKAEELKCTAANSKYARQIFQAMRPIFADLVAEIQRSIGFYGSTHREIELKQVLACGNAFQLPGLQKYLENNLTVEGGVHKIEGFKRAILAPTLGKKEEFNERALGFGVAYGLALQGLGLGAIQANLLPPELARLAMWRKKTPYFIATAACIGLASLFPTIRTSMDRSALASTNIEEANRARSTITGAQQIQSEYTQATSDTTQKQARIEKIFELQKDKSLVPMIVEFVHEALPEEDPALTQADTPEKLKRLIKSNPNLTRTNRGTFIIENLDITYFSNIDTADRPPDRTNSSGQPGMSTPTPTGTPGPGRGSGRSVNPGANPLAPGNFGPDAGPGPSVTNIPGGSDADAGPIVPGQSGFYVRVSGRSLYGRTQADATQFITTKLIDRIKQIGKKPGWGFFVPDDDPKTGMKNLAPEMVTPTYYYNRGAMAPIGQPQPNDPTQAQTIQFKDPVTEEDMVTDWKVNFAFKIKIGEPPAAAPANAPGQPGQPNPGGKP